MLQSETRPAHMHALADQKHSLVVKASEVAVDAFNLSNELYRNHLSPVKNLAPKSAAAAGRLTPSAFFEDWGTGRIVHAPNGSLGQHCQSPNLA